jgi:hypothetical protein
MLWLFFFFFLCETLPLWNAGKLIGIDVILVFKKAKIEVIESVIMTIR